MPYHICRYIACHIPITNFDAYILSEIEERYRFVGVALYIAKHDVELAILPKNRIIL